MATKQKYWNENDRPDFPGTVCTEPTMTRASEAAGCDINKIMERFEKTGILPEAIREGIFADVSQVGDYRTMQNQMVVAQQAFDQLPYETRHFFNDSVAALLDFVVDPANHDQAVELGILPPPPAKPTIPPPEPPKEAPTAPQGAKTGS